MIAGGNILDRDLRVEAAAADALGECLADIMIELVPRGHVARVLLGELHQVGVEGDRAEAIVAAVTGNHRLLGCPAGGGASLAQPQIPSSVNAVAMRSTHFAARVPIIAVLVEDPRRDNAA